MSPERARMVERARSPPRRQRLCFPRRVDHQQGADVVAGRSGLFDPTQRPRRPTAHGVAARSSCHRHRRSDRARSSARRIARTGYQRGQARRSRCSQRFVTRRGAAPETRARPPSGAADVVDRVVRVAHDLHLPRRALMPADPAHSPSLLATSSPPTRRTTSGSPTTTSTSVARDMPT